LDAYYSKDKEMTDFSQELKKDFLDEAYELLDKLEKSLLTLEKDPGNDKEINEVFRAAHTIKGGAGTLGFTEIQDLTHVMEDILDLARKKNVTFVYDDISTLLLCHDELDKMVKNRESDTIYDNKLAADLRESLLAIKKRSGIAPAEPAKVKAAESAPVNAAVLQEIEFSFSNMDISLMSDSISNNKNIFNILYSLNESYEMKEVSSFQIYALLSDISDIIKMKPTVSDYEAGFSRDIGFVISTDREEQFIRDKTFMKDLVSHIKIRKIDLDKIREMEALMGKPEPAADQPEGIEPAQQAQGQKGQAAAPEAEVQDASIKKEPSPDASQKRNVATLRVESWKIDELLNLLGELVITKASFMQMNSDFDKAGIDIKAVLKEFMSGIQKLNLTGNADEVEHKNSVLFKSMSELYITFESFSENMQRLNRISSSLQENVMKMRMVPIQMVFSRFPRLIRDMAEKINKKVEIDIAGVETEIDKGMVDDIFDPLIHILRNSVDHGIETPEERKAAGKNETGKIILKAVHEGDSIVIEAADDGKGIDIEAVRNKAIENRMVSREAAAVMTQKDLLGMIFLPGLSTAKVVTDISGRGVGMDVVKKKIEEIGGSVLVSTVKGKGTKITIRLPLTLAIIQGLIIVVNKMHYIIPVAAVEETVIINLKDLKDIDGKLTLELRGKFIPIMSLKKYFYNEDIKTGSDDKDYCIVAKFGDSFIGILVSEVIGEQDIVIKPLNTKLIKSPGISAATIIGNGEIGYIIDTSQIIAQYFKNRAD